MKTFLDTALVICSGWNLRGRFLNRPYGVRFCFVAAIGFLMGIGSAYGQLATTAVYVGNQGNFSDANGTVSIYDPGSGSVTADGVPNLNTLVQSISLYKDKGYIIANTSDRIDVIDLADNMRIGQITGVPSPRYLTVVDENKAYVSSLFGNSITIIDLSNNTVVGSIGAGSNPEDIAVVSELAYVANNGFGFDSTLTVIDTRTDQPVDTLALGCDGPRSLDVDGQQELWVVCSGKTVYNDDFTEIIEETNGQVIVLDVITGAMITRFQPEAQLGAASAGQDAYYDPIADRLFVILGNDLLVFDTTENNQLDTISIPGDESIGGVAYDASSDYLYAARITGFTTSGFVSIHDPSGLEIDRFDAGIVPTSIALLQTGTSVGIARQETPASFRVFQNYPNPFNAATTIGFEMANATAVSLKIFNVIGEEVAALFEGVRPAGAHEIQWHADGLPSGLYFYRIEAGDFSITKPMTLRK